MDRVVALPGTLCPPAVFDRLAVSLGTPVAALSWLTESGPWTIAAVARRVARTIETLGTPDAAPADGAERGVVLCGHSTGGAIALRVALDRPDLIRRLVLLDTGAHMQGHGDVGAIIRRVRDDWGEDLRAAVLDRSFDTTLDPALRRTWLDWSATVPAQAVEQVLTSQAALDLRPELGAVRVPTAVVHGALDRARSLADAEQLAAGIPGARLTVLGTGHSPMHEAPDAVAAVVRALIGVVTER